MVGLTPTPYAPLQGGELRKIRILGLSVAGLLLFTAIAFAAQENIYTVSGGVSPNKIGTKKKPSP